MNNLISAYCRLGGASILMSCAVFKWQLKISLRKLPSKSGSYPDRELVKDSSSSAEEGGRRLLTNYLPIAHALPLGWMFRLGRYPREL